MERYIIDSIEESIALKQELLRSEKEIQKIKEVALLIFDCLKSGGKVLFCGNGGSASDAQHLAAEFVGRFSCDRAPLAAIALTTDTSILTAVGNDFGFEHIFERQVAALASEGDILIAITTSGNSSNIAKALECAKEKGVKRIGLLGGSGGSCKELCDHSFVINNKFSARVQELHIMVGHIICGIVDEMVKGEASRNSL